MHRINSRFLPRDKPGLANRNIAGQALPMSGIVLCRQLDMSDFVYAAYRFAVY